MDIKNDAQLKKILMEKSKIAVANVEKKVYKEFEDNVNKFYSEFEPEYYIRTGALGDSLMSTGIIGIGDGVMAEVGFDTPAYTKGWIPLQNGGYGLAAWSNEKILNVAMTGGRTGYYPHGGYEGGTAIWKESMNSLGGRKGIEKLIKEELKKQGL